MHFGSQDGTQDITGGCVVDNQGACRVLLGSVEGTLACILASKKSMVYCVLAPKISLWICECVLTPKEST